MIRSFFSLSALAILTACSSAGTSPVVSAIKGVILPLKAEDVPVAKTGSTLTREKIEQFGLALIRGRIEGEEISNLLTGTAVNDQYVTYVSSFRQNVAMLGGLVTGTRGLGGDLLAVSAGASDPVAYLIPVAEWPTSLKRDYRFPGVGPAGKTVSVNCNLTRAAETTLTIVEVTYDVTPFTEVCSGDGTEFTNTYLAQPDTGQIWQSQQWVGEKVGYLNIDVLEPYSLE